MEEFKKFKKYIDGHRIESKESALKVTMAIQSSELNAGHGNYTRTLHVPKMFSQADKKRFEKIVDTTYTIFSKTIEAYRKDPAIRKLFPFSKELEELILLRPRYPIPIPICRIDVFYDENHKEFHFCEFNTDGTSAMNENRRLNEFLDLNNAFTALKPDCEIMELMESWVDAFLLTYASSFEAKSDPHIAIVDFLENAYLSELYEFEKLFKKRGFVCEVVDIRDLKYDGSKLVNVKTNTTFDVIYRRAVTKDVMEHYDELKDNFIQCVKDGNVVLIGAFQTQIVHHKCINQVLFDKTMRTYFTEEECAFLDEHLPKTYDLTLDVANRIVLQKADWIIKPKDSYAAKGVWAGCDLNQEHWAQVLYDFVDHDYIAQEYIPPFKSENIDLVNYDHWMMYSNLTGLYTYNGVFAGVYSRMSDSGIISTQYNEKTVPTLFLSNEE